MSRSTHFHPWHSLPTGAKAPEIVTAYMEIPVGSRQKYEIDKESGLLFLDRVLSSPVFYPMNYGFIPQTYCDDGDALDIMVMGFSEPVIPGSIMNARVLGAMKMIDGGEEDDKIVAVHHNDPRLSHIQSLQDLEQAFPHCLKETQQFFKTYKLLEKKQTEVSGFVDKEAAIKIIEVSQAFYKKTYT